MAVAALVQAFVAAPQTAMPRPPVMAVAAAPRAAANPERVRNLREAIGSAIGGGYGDGTEPEAVHAAPGAAVAF